MKRVLLVALSVFAGFAYGMAWQDFSATHTMMRGSEYVGISGLAVLAGFGLKGNGWRSILCHGAWMVAGYLLSRIF